MAEKTFKITFQPDGETIEVEAGSTILDGARKAGAFINSPCGGRQTCGKCRVRVVSGEVKSAASHLVSGKERAEGWHLACGALPLGDVEVEIPPEARGLPGQIAAAHREEPAARPAWDPGPLSYLVPDPVFRQSPLATKFFCDMSAPDLDDAVSDLDRLRRCLAVKHDFERIYTDIDLVRGLPRALRDAGFKVTVTLGKRGGNSAEILAVEPGDKTGRNFGAALDIGTTTMVLHILDLETGETKGLAASLNRQAEFGADVITRIFHASQPGGLEELHGIVIGNVNDLVRAACADASLASEEVSCLQIAANTTMTQLFLDVDPTWIRKEPYVATANFFPQVSARDLGIRIHPAAMVSTSPAVASYVGGDVVAGVIASGLSERDEIALFIDLGTNGEMVLGNREWLACTSCSVGPAFEGSGIRCGMRAEQGAIQEIRLGNGGEEVRFSTIGDATATGVCGSGLIDLMANLKSEGVVDRTGRFQPDRARTRLRSGDEGLEFVITSGSDREIYIAQTDLENLLRSKAAVYAASALLVKKMGITFDDVDRIFLAGGFGSYIDFEKAIQIGLLPDQPREKFAFVGNSSLTGAKMGLRFEAARDRARRIAPMMTYIELSGDNAYHEEFMSALFLPHTDLSQFPSVEG